MAILIQVNGNNSGEGFLIAPDGARTFPVTVGLRLDVGAPVAATLRGKPGVNVGGLAFSTTAVDISTTESFVQIHATANSANRDDTVLEVVVSGVVQAHFDLTAIADPQVWFKGRFQARFSTDNSPYNHPRGFPLEPFVSGVANKWTWALDGEPDFVPADNVPTTITKPVGRVVRFHNPVALRSRVPPIGVSVVAISGTVSSGMGTQEEFTVGDPIIGLPVDLGPNSYFASNRPPTAGDPPRAESYGAGFERIALFEFHIGNLFSGTSHVTTPDAIDDARPQAGGLPALDPDETITALSTFETARRNQLIADFDAMTAAEQVAQAGQNLRIRIGHLGGDTTRGITRLMMTLPPGWTNMEEYNGTINENINFQPGNSVVVDYLAGYNAFAFFGRFFNFHSDELCGQVHGSVIADTFSDVTPFQNGVYNIDSREATPFAALNIAQMTPANIDTALGASPVAEKAVVSVSSDYDRLVVSKAVIANPADPPASWTITSRGESLIGEFLPDASVFPRDLVYRILQPGEQGRVLGACEGTHFDPAPDVGFARLFPVGDHWKLLLHAGTNAAAGVTYRGTYADSPATVPTGCAAPTVELLTPTIDFGSVEQGMTMFRQIALLNRSASPVDITLPVLSAPFGAPGVSTITIAPNDIGFLSVSFAAGAPGLTPPTPFTLTANPVVSPALIVSLTGTSVAVTTVDAVLVLDRSFSMTEPALNEGGRFISKNDLRNEAAQVFVDLLRPGDRIGMVRFNQDAQPHMALQEAGAEMTGAGRLAAATALASSDLDPSGSTSVGDGMVEGNTMLTAPSTATNHALVVLTDGKENQAQFINSVVLGSSVKTYAIGLGLPQEVNVDKLSAIAGNTGGYLLVTGALDAENEFRLHKYYAQILAGIHGESIVLDPRGVIAAGDVHRIPFFVTEGDSHFDVVLLAHSSLLRFSLEAPDGSRVDAGNVSSFNGLFVDGRACRYYRMTIPIFAGDPARALGRWHIVIDYPGKRRYQGALALRRAANVRPNDDRRKGFLLTVSTKVGIPYNVLVRARSSIQMDAQIEQRGFGPGLDRTVVAFVRAFGQPLSANLSLFAHVTRPDGITSLLPLKHQGDGRFEAQLADSKMLGHYSIVVRAAGQTPGNWPLQREQTLSGIVIDPAADNNENEITGILKDQQEALKDLAQRFKDLLLAFQSASQPPAPAKPDTFGKWLLWILIILILILLLIFWSILKQ